MKDFTFKRGNIEDLDLIKPLCEKLNQLHLDLSPDFKSIFRNRTWELRKTDLIKKSGKILIDYLTDDQDCIIGYCISTIDSEDKKIGEIDSIYIDKIYIKTGIGKQLMDRAIDWLILKGTKTQKLNVGAGNEQVLELYNHFNFYPVNIVLQRIEKNS